MSRIKKHSRLDEDVPPPTLTKVGITVANKDTKKPRREDNNNRGKKNSEGVFTVFKDPLYKILPQIRDKPFFKWPPKLGGDPTARDQKRFCSYHREKAHRTDECRYLKNHLKNLAKVGNLDQYIDKEKMK